MKQIVIDKNELIELLRQTFIQGANSYENWLHISNKVWRQVKIDSEHYLEIEIEDFLQNLTK